MTHNVRGQQDLDGAERNGKDRSEMGLHSVQKLSGAGGPCIEGGQVTDCTSCVMISSRVLRITVARLNTRECFSLPI